MSEMLLEHFTPTHRVALLSRGYGRKSRGYIEVESSDSYLSVGDEPLQIKRKFPSTLVVVCEKRVEGVRRIIEKHPDIELVIMDDGFQHRQITPTMNIIMVDATRPIATDAPLPLGSLRDSRSSLHRADVFVVTKCPDTITKEQIDQMRRELKMKPTQKVLFSKIVTAEPLATYATNKTPFDATQMQVIALAGIGNPAPFTDTLRKRYNLVAELLYRDHHSYTPTDLESIAKELDTDTNRVIVTTEKDSVKFLANSDVPQIIKDRLYYTPIRMEFIDGDEGGLLKSIEKLC